MEVPRLSLLAGALRVSLVCRVAPRGSTGISMNRAPAGLRKYMQISEERLLPGLFVACAGLGAVAVVSDAKEVHRLEGDR